MVFLEMGLKKYAVLVPTAVPSPHATSGAASSDFPVHPTPLPPDD